MPVSWEWRDSVLLVTTIGRYANQELADAFVKMSADTRFVRGTPVVFDARRSEAELTKGDIDWRVASFADSLQRAGFGPKLAFVLTKDEPHRYGIARMVQALSQLQGFDTQIFGDVEAALCWAREEASKTEH